MQHEFLDTRHQYSPRRVFSTTDTDWQARVDFGRMRRERLQRTRDKMEEHDIDALILFVGENVRYVTGVFQGNWKNNIFIRYAVLPRGGEPVLFETVGSDKVCAEIDAPWLNDIRPAITWKWAEGADEMMARRMADVIVDINAVGPGGYFIDFVRCWKVDGKPSPKDKDLYKECYESLYAAIEEMKPGNTTADVAKRFPEYDDDKYGSVSLQQFAHSIGLSLYEGMWVSRAYSLDYPAEIKPNMYFAIETFASRPGLEQAVRLEENIVITEDGNAITTLCEHPSYWREE